MKPLTGLTTANAGAAIASMQALTNRTGSTSSPPKSVAGLLDLTPHQLNNELRRGKSLNDLAAERGVPHDELIDSILGRRDASPKERRMAEKLANLKFPPTLRDGELEEHYLTLRHHSEPDHDDRRTKRNSAAGGTAHATGEASPASPRQHRGGLIDRTL